MFWKKTKKVNENVSFIQNAGGCICTKSVLNKDTQLRWCYRSESVNAVDNGWRFIGMNDDEEYINVVENNVVVDFNTVANIEPAILAIYYMPVGTDLYIDKTTDKIRFFDTNSNEEIDVTGYSIYDEQK